MELGSAKINKLFLPEEKKYTENKAENINPANENNALAFMVNAITENSTVLDVGCAYGYVGEWLNKNKNCRMYGADIDSEALNYVKSAGYYSGLFNIDLDYTGRFGKEFERFNALNEDLFDFIICADVLEHLKDPTGALEIISSKLKLSGQVVISIPNIAHLDIILNLLEGKFNYSDFGLLDNTHLRFFTKESFIEWINSANERFKEKGYQFDVKLSGETRYSSEFLDNVRLRHPKLYNFFMDCNSELLILQNIIILTKLNKQANAFEISRLLKNIDKDDNILSKIDGDLIDRENLQIELNETLNILNETAEEKQNLQIELNETLNILNETAEEKQNLQDGLNGIYKSDFWKLASFYYKLRDETVLQYPFKFLRKVKRKVKNDGGIQTDKNTEFLKKLSKSNSSSYRNRIKWYSDGSPLISIIILNYNKTRVTLQCIEEVWKHTKGAKYEIIVVDNGSEPGDKEYFKQAGSSYYKLIELSKNRFFGEGNNIGSEKAKGKYLLFLNNDAFVTPDWLMPLVSAVNSDDTAAAGPKFLYPDGKLQEAGAYINSDGTALQRGKFDNPDKPEYNSVLEADYCSAACLIVRRALFDEVLGFDMCWEPAYYEDADLCFKFKALNKKIMYMPSSKIVHLENLTSSDEKFPLKLNNIVDINREKFVRRYKNILSQLEK